MGINEKRFGWMDEGWADFADFFIGGPHSSDYGKYFLAKQFVGPAMIPSYTQPIHSGINSYTIGALSYYSLYHLLGEDLFKKCMKAYIDRWKYKHPSPYDFMFTFSDVSGINLNWFWKRWYFDWAYPDVGIEGYENNSITIENLGGRPLAFEIVYTYADSSESSQIVSPEVWNGSSIYILEVPGEKQITQIKLRTHGGSDAVSGNNLWSAE